MEIFFTEFNLLKSIISSVVVLILIFISERNPKLGGLLAGLPIGTGIVIYFYAIEQNIDFVIKGIPFGIAGLVSSLAFTIGFYLGGKMNSKTPIISTLFSSVFGILMFFLVSFSLIHLNINLSTSLFNFLIGLIISVLSFRNIKNNIEITPKKNTITTVLFRCFLVTFTIILITGIAKNIGAQWAGIMASFPTGLFPLLIILSYSYKDKVYPIVIKNFVFGITTLVLFYLLVLLLFPKVGIYYGLILSYLLCFLNVYLLSKIEFFKSLLYKKT